MQKNHKATEGKAHIYELEAHMQEEVSGEWEDESKNKTIKSGAPHNQIRRRRKESIQLDVASLLNDGG